ncbi:heparan sulfate glucosamine 3-O-sulfotransferase 1-like [Asterias rubens]|uniref:heparan sulfate glucosamine 3-O-sulfotransferase 1-like n=1 Tax=Asterias rubens TaxID=7604 RepID=UPI0014557530|nr:heparan sulfate glucosamine 3-O-sulfotransferase 1-like [Asterias rubens]
MHKFQHCRQIMKLAVIIFRTIVLAGLLVTLAEFWYTQRTWLYSPLSPPSSLYSPLSPPSAESFNIGQCYSYSQTGQPRLPLLPLSVRTTLGCNKKLPRAIVIGVKKGGTGAFKFFLRYHPQVSYTNGEPHYFSVKKFNYNAKTYKTMMAESTSGQLTVEGTPSYFSVQKTANRVKKALPHVKLILLLRDPVKRAISDYVHVQQVMTTERRHDDTRKRSDIQIGSRYEIASTFKESIFHSNGSLKTYNLLLVKGQYVNFLSRWLEQFPLKRILILDGSSFTKDPLPTLKKVEEFLGITPYFTPDHFKFIEEKGFYCLQKPIEGNCLASNKGRPPPQVSEEVIQTLRDYYGPFNERLNKMLNRTFSWSI